MLRAEDVHLDDDCPFWVVRGKPTKHRPDGVRHVALSPSLVELSRKLLAQNPNGLLFRNRAGTAWHPGLIDAFVYRLVKRLRKAGHKLPSKVIPYGLRHNFATDLLGGGTHDYDVSQLMGHSGTKMVHAVYSRLVRALGPVSATRIPILHKNFTIGGPLLEAAPLVLDGDPVQARDDGRLR